MPIIIKYLKYLMNTEIGLFYFLIDVYLMVPTILNWHLHFQRILTKCFFLF